MRKRKSADAERTQVRKKSIVREKSLPSQTDQRAPSANSVVDAARQRMISEAAYYGAQRRSFAPGRELDDWWAAEAEIAQSFLEQQPAAADLH